MKFSNIFFIALAVFLSLGILSCKKENDDDYLSFDGNIRFDYPKYVSSGETYTFKFAGLSRPDGGTFGVRWHVAPTMSVADTVRRKDEPLTVPADFTFTIPDTLCTLTLTCYAFQDDYYSSYVQKEITIIDPAKSLTGCDFSKAAGEFKDSRDDKTYPFVRAAGLDWMAKNLAYEGLGGMSYEQCDIMKHLFGMFYSWEDAMKACPDGWRLPTDSEWVALAKETNPDGSYYEYNTLKGVTGDWMADAYLNGGKLWDYWPEVKVTNRMGMNMLSAGYASSGKQGSYSFSGGGKYAAFWTGDEYADDLAVYRYFYDERPDVYVSTASRDSFLMSVRCVRDAGQK